MKLSRAIENFWELKSAEVASKETMRYYKPKLSMIKRYLGDYPVSKINKQVIAKFTNDQKIRNPKISPKTLNKYRNIIVRIIKDTTGRKIDINKIRESRTMIKSITEENIKKILLYYKSNINKFYNLKYYLIINIFLDTGVRISELVNIKISNINLERRSIYLDVTKTDVGRTIFFTTKTKEILVDYLQNFSETKKYLFPGDNPSGHIGQKTIYESLIRLQKRLKIKQSISPHKWRHTCAKRLMNVGGSTRFVQKILGHTELSTTQMYLQYNNDEIKSMYDSLLS